MNKKYSIILILILLAASSVLSREITLREALMMAESHSYQVKASRAQSEALQSGLKAAISERMPTLTATGVASYRDKVAHLEVALPTGDVFRRDVGLKENYQADFRLNVPLFTGGRITGGVDFARASSAYYDAIAGATLDEVYLMARLAYISLYKGDRLVEVAEAGLKRAQTIASDVQSLYEAGAADSVSLLDASLALTVAKSRLNEATSLRRQSEISLSILLGLDPSEAITVNFSPEPPEILEQDLQGVSDTKPELVAALSAVGMSRSLVKVNRADFWPSVSLFGGYSWGKPNLDQFHDEFNDYFTVGAVVNWAFNLGGKSIKNVRKVTRQLTSAEFEYEKTKEQLDRNARLAIESLKLSYDNYRTAVESRRISSDHFRLASEKHREGVMSANRLIEIEADLTEAESLQASTLAEFYMAQSQYFHAIGSESLKEGM